MPYLREKHGVSVTNTTGSALTHGKPISLGGGEVTGIAVKQKNVSIDLGLAAQNQIATSERFFVLTKEEVEVAMLGSATVGDLVFIDDSAVVSGGHALAATSNSGANPVFGRVTAIEDDVNGTPHGKMRVDLSQKV